MKTRLIICVIAITMIALQSVIANPFWNNGEEFVNFQTLANLSHWNLSIVVAADGSVIAGGPMRSADGGGTWQHIADYPTTGAGFILDETTGDLLKLDSGTKPMPIMYRSKDNGITWQQESIIRTIDSRCWLPTNMHCDAGTTLKYGENAGRLLMAARVFVRYLNPGKYLNFHYSSALYSDDGGKTWLASEPFPFDGTGEAGLVELSDGSIYYNSRTHNRFGNRLVAKSYDGGKTWIEGRECDYLPDGPPDLYGCKGGLVRLPLDDHDILIYSQNDDPGGGDEIHSTEGRENLTIWASFDGGITWPVSRRLTTEGGYSSLAAGRTGTPSEGMIYLLSHSGFFARFNLAWITQEQDWQNFLPNE